MAGQSWEDLREACLRKVGSVIDGKYTLVDLIGFGATGAVYKAQNNWAGRTYALKLFHYRGPDQQSALQRFVREAQAANRVVKNGRQHPNVVDAFDVGRDRETGQFFIVQELLEGETLAQYLYRQPGRRVLEDDALRLLRPVLDAVAGAHDVGIVHRDLKPENVFLSGTDPSGDPIPKVLDFGIAQLADARMTPTYELLGTPQYMPPEAFNGAGKVDARADVWALGTILYEMVAGAPPFGADMASPFDVMKAIAATEPPSLASLGTMSHAVWITVRRALSKNPAGRFRTANEMAEALDAAALPPRTLRVPHGATPDALRELIRSSPERQRTGVHSSVRGVESDLPPPVDPTHAWWVVTFTNTGHTAAEITELLALPELANLVELHITGNALGDDGVRALAESPCLRDLTVLALRKVGAGVAAIEALARSPGVTNLVKLDLEDNPVGAAGVRALGDSPCLAGLRTLNLVLTELDAEGARALADGALLSGLTRVDLSQNRLGDDGGHALARASRLDPALVLALGRNGLSQGAMDATVAALRNRIRKVVV